MTNYQTALIDESACIGCTKCIQACPFDAIIGASKQIHTVLKSECTGCGLCLPPCPTDCITLISIQKPLFSHDRAKKRRLARRERLQRHGVDDQKMELCKEAFASIPSNQQEMRSAISDAIARAKQKRQNL